MLLRNKIIFPSTLVWFCWVSLINGQSNHFKELLERFFLRDHSDSNIIRAFLPEPHQVQLYHTPNSDVIIHFLIKNSDDDIYHSSQSVSSSTYPTSIQIPKLTFHPQYINPPFVDIRSIQTPNRGNKMNDGIDSPKPLNLAKDKNQVFDDIPKKVNTSNNIKEIKFPVIPVNLESNVSSGERKPFTGITNDADEDEERVIPIIPIETGLEGLDDISDSTPTEETNSENQTNKNNINDKSSIDNPISTNLPEKQHPVSDAWIDIPPVTTNGLPHQTFDNLEDLLNRTLPNTTIFINTRSTLPKNASSKYKANTLSVKSENIVKDENFLSETDPGNPPVPLNQQPNTLLIGDWLELSKQMYHKLGPSEKKRVYEANKAVISGKYLNHKSDNDGTDIELKPFEDLYLVAERKNIGKDKKSDSDLNKNSLDTASVGIDSRFNRHYVNLNNGTSESLEETTSNKSEDDKKNKNNNSTLPELNKKNNDIEKENSIASNLIETQNFLERNITSEHIENDDGIEHNLIKPTTTNIVSMFDQNSNKENIKNSDTFNFNGSRTQDKHDTDTTPDPSKNNDATKYNWMETTTSTAPTNILSIFDQNFKDSRDGKKSATPNVSTVPTKNRNISKNNSINTTPTTPIDFFSVFDRIFNNEKLFGTETMNTIRNVWTSGSNNTNNKNVIHSPITSNTASPASNVRFTDAVINDVIQRLLRSAWNEVAKSYTENAGRELIKRVTGK